MSFGAFSVAMAAAIMAPRNYTMICFFIGCAGAMFVTKQFRCALTFAPSVVGTALQSWRRRDPDLYDVGTCKILW